MPGLLLAFAVLHQQAGDRRAQSRLPFLQRKLDLLARFFLSSFLGERENAVDGVPELGERARQKRALLGCSAGRGESSLQPHGIVKIVSNALELRRPGGKGIRFVVAHHVPHGNCEQDQVVLDSQ